eukprot:scaffold93009_cov60-Phaeocystis_antarctica.AAC.6
MLSTLSSPLAFAPAMAPTMAPTRAMPVMQTKEELATALNPALTRWASAPPTSGAWATRRPTPSCGTPRSSEQRSRSTTHSQHTARTQPRCSLGLVRVGIGSRLTVATVPVALRPAPAVRYPIQH